MCQHSIPDDLMLLLLKQNGRRDAVNFYREQTGANRAEAKQAVRKLQQQHPDADTASYADYVLLLLVVVSMLLGALIS
jgi:hypothetical protein